MKEQITIDREQFDAARRLFAAVQEGKADVRRLSFSRFPDVQPFGHRALRAAEDPQRFSQPDLTDVHIDVPLTNISIAYRNPMLIAAQVFPRVLVQKESGKYFTFGRDSWIRDEAAIRSTGGHFPRVGYTTSTGSYAVDEYGIESPIDDRVRANADDPISPDRNAVNLCTDKVDLKIEKEVKSALFTAANWSGSATLSGTDQFSDYSNSDPLGKVYVAQETVLTNCGFMPNTGVIGYQGFVKLAQHPDLLDRIKYTGSNERPAMVTAQMMAQLFELNQLLVGRALQDTSVEGGTAAPGFIWDKKMWIGYVSSVPALETPSAGYVFTTGRQADRYRDERAKSDVARVSEAFDVKVTAAGAGYLYSAIVA